MSRKKMWRNVVVAASNFTCVYPLWKSISVGDYVTSGVLSFVAGASIVSHLAENHKHGMPGIGWSKRTSYILNRLDVLGCLLTAGRLGYMYYSRYGLTLSPMMDDKLLLATSLIAFGFLRISEFDKSSDPQLRTLYMVTHSIWHVTIFKLIGCFLGQVLYG